MILVKNALFIIFLFLYNLSYSQYKFNRTIISMPSFSGFENSSISNVAFDGYDSHIFLMKRENTEIDLYNIDIDNNSILSHAKLNNVPSFLLRDMSANNNNLLLIGNNKVLNFNTHTNSFTFSKYLDSSRKVYFDKGMNINDTLFILGGICQFHPLDGKSGLYLNVYNGLKNEVIKSKRFDFPGLLLSSMSLNLITVCGETIFVFTPISKYIYVFNLNLDIVDKYKLDIFSNHESNDNFEFRLDSLMNKEDDFIRETKKNNSIIYTKDFLSNTIDSVRKNMTFIEKVFSVNDSLIALVISKPDYEFKYRDLLFYNPITKKKVKEIIKWNCAGEENLNNFEDYFSVAIFNDECLAPYFFRDKIYNWTNLPIKLYEKTNKSNLNLKMFNYIKDNGYTWSFLEYSY